MKILIVDDRSEKAAVIKKTITNNEQIQQEGIDLDVEIVLCLRDAKIALHKVLYDLMILDLHMPLIIGDDMPDSENGISFIDEVCSTEALMIPMDIVAMTALSDAKEKFSADKRLAGFEILHYDETQQEWRDFLISRVQYLHRCNLQRRIGRRLPPCDVLWLTATKIENESVEERFDFSQYTIPDDATTYGLAEMVSEGKKIHIVHVGLQEMGMTSAAAMTTKASIRFRPRYIVMTGIAAGLANDMNFGDVMFAESTWNYDMGKYVEVDEHGITTVKLTPDGNTLNLSYLDAEAVAQFVRGNRAGIQVPGGKIGIAKGVFACGNAVVASALKIRENISAHKRKTIGIDMESYGVMLAASSSLVPPISAFVLKGISDKADTDKDDEYQELAAKNSALVAVEFIRHLFLSSDGFL